MRCLFSFMDPDWNDACPIANKNTSGILDPQSTFEKNHDSIVTMKMINIPPKWLSEIEFTTGPPNISLLCQPLIFSQTLWNRWAHGLTHALVIFREGRWKPHLLPTPGRYFGAKRSPNKHKMECLDMVYAKITFKNQEKIRRFPKNGEYLQILSIF